MRRILPLFALAIALSACSSSTAQLSGNNASRGARVVLNEVPVKRYTSAAYKYSIAYPEAWTISERNILRVGDEDKEGTSFSPPASMINGTPVTDVRIHVAYLDDGCPSSSTAPISLGERRFFTASWSNSTDEFVEQAKTYSLAGNGGCYAITLYTSTCRNDGCIGDTSSTLNRKPLTDAFRQMSASLNLL